jgi:uncharacterized protein YceH (UPF0502 family)
MELTMPCDDLELPEQRVLGALIEKARTTPDYYPMRLSQLVAACNQKSNREPVVSYDETTVERALERLADRNLAFRVYAPDVRGIRWRHGIETTLALKPAEEALVCVLLLRGPQTLGELRSRSERMHAFTNLEEVEQVIQQLEHRSLVGRLPRHPGQKDARYSHRLGTTPPLDVAQEPSSTDGGELLARIRSLEEELARVRRTVDALTARLEHALRTTTSPGPAQ